VLGVQAARQPPRYAPVSRVRQIMQEAKIEEVEVAGIDGSCGSTVRRMYMPERGEGAKMLAGDTDAVADQIVALIKGKKV
jgi:electron transfer flavoprotein beta subunit